MRHGDLVDPHDGVLAAARVPLALLPSRGTLSPDLRQFVGRVDGGHVGGVGQLQGGGCSVSS